MSISKAAPWFGGARFVRPTVEVGVESAIRTVLREGSRSQSDADTR